MALALLALAKEHPILLCKMRCRVKAQRPSVLHVSIQAAAGKDPRALFEIIRDVESDGACRKGGSGHANIVVRGSMKSHVLFGVLSSRYQARPAWVLYTHGGNS